MIKDKTTGKTNKFWGNVVVGAIIIIIINSFFNFHCFKQAFFDLIVALTVCTAGLIWVPIAYVIGFIATALLNLLVYLLTKKKIDSSIIISSFTGLIIKTIFKSPNKSRFWIRVSIGFAVMIFFCAAVNYLFKPDVINDEPSLWSFVYWVEVIFMFSTVSTVGIALGFWAILAYIIGAIIEVLVFVTVGILVSLYGIITTGKIDTSKFKYLMTQVDSTSNISAQFTKEQTAIINYIEKAKCRNYTDKEISTALKTAGWSDAKINEAFELYKTNK